MSKSSVPVPDRRADLDWLRLGAFGLLIVYHAGMAWSGWKAIEEAAHRKAEGFEPGRRGEVRQDWPGGSYNGRSERPVYVEK